jgi:hypothetical protein
MADENLMCYYSDLPSPLAYLALQDEEEKKINQLSYLKKILIELLKWLGKIELLLKRLNFSLD